MAILINATILGNLTLETAASASGHAVRLGEMNAALAGKSDAGHTHNDIYFTEAEVTSLLSAKAASAHTHDDRYYTEAEADALLAAKAAASHSHNDLYFTEAEVTASLAGKADTAHTHDDRYFTEAETTAAVEAAVAAADYDAIIEARKADSTTVVWSVTEGALQANVPLGDADTSLRAKLVVSSGKVYTELGTTAFTAAAGNHAHDAASGALPGFMTAAQYTKLANIAENALAVAGVIEAVIEAGDDTNSMQWASSGGSLKMNLRVLTAETADQARLLIGASGVYLPTDDTNSVALASTGVSPVMTATVRRKATATSVNAILSEDSTGLYFEMGAVSGKPKPGDWLPDDATNATDGLATAAQITMLESHESPEAYLAMPAQIWATDDGDTLGGETIVRKGASIRGIAMEHTVERNLTCSVPLPAHALKASGTQRLRLLFANNGTSGTAVVNLELFIADTGAANSGETAEVTLVFTDSDAIVHETINIDLPGLVESPDGWNYGLLSVTITRDGVGVAEDTLATSIFFLGAEVQFQHNSLGDGWD